MAPKRKTAGRRAQGDEAKKAKTTHADGEAKAIADRLLADNTTYCEELGINLQKGGPEAVFQWLCCSIIFGNRLSEKTTIRAAAGLIKSGLTDPKAVKETDFKAKIDALNSEGNVQRGPTMASRLEATSALLLEKYDGDLSKLREAAGKDPAKERKLVKQFKGFGDVAVNIFCREAQLAWEELFPFADKNTLDMAAKLGLPSGSAKELADLVDNDRDKFVKLLAAVVKQNLRGGKGIGGEDAAEDAGEQQDPATGEDAGEQEDPAPAGEPEDPADGEDAGAEELPADEEEAEVDGEEEDDDEEGPVDAADEARAAADDEDYDEEQAAADDEDYDEDEE